MKAPLNQTKKGLLARGVDSAVATQLMSAGYTISSLKTKTIAELCSLGLAESVAENIRSGRTPIPEATLLKLLFDNKWVCCVCRSKDSPIVVHHIEPWATSRSHSPENLVVLCPTDHAKAHSRGDLSQNLSQERLRAIKREWEAQVKTDDSIVIRQAAQTAGECWHFFNLIRLYEIAEHENIDLLSLRSYEQARSLQIIDLVGHLVPESTGSMYAYTGRHALLRYRYARDLFLNILDRLSVTNVSDRLDRSDLNNTVIRNDIIYVEGAFSFKQLTEITAGENQTVRGTRSANDVRIDFTFDRWLATSCSAHSMWLTGRHALGCFCRVGDVSREDGKIVISCTLLAICNELPGQRSRSYISSSMPMHRDVSWDEDQESASNDSDDYIS